MSENRFSSQSHENNGQGNGVLHKALPGTLPEELLRQAAKAKGERALNEEERAAAAGTDAGGLGGERNKFRSTEQGHAAEDPASRAASAAGDRAPRSDGRSNDGRIFYGNKGGPGNPYARKVALIKQEILTYCTPEDRRDIMLAMIERAKAGDVQAAKFVYGYTAGKQTPGPDPDRLDAQEWQGLRESATWMDESPAILSRPSGRMALDMVRVAQPEMDKQRAREMNFVLSAKGKTEEKVREHLLDPVNGLEKLPDQFASETSRLKWHLFPIRFAADRSFDLRLRHSDGTLSAR